MAARTKGLVSLAAALLSAVVALLPHGAHAQGIPLIRDTEIETLLNDYSRPIFRAAGLGDGRIAVRIVRSDVYNAFVLDGRNVFIHTGALTQSDTPNQIIGVIAHETGHIAGGHMAALRARIARDQTRLLLLRVLGIGAAIAGGGAAAIAAGDELVMRSLLAERRSQEGAADQAGLRYLNMTKQSGRGMLETFERFAQQEFVSDAQRDPFVRSHPVATDRLANLRDLVERAPNFNTKDTPELQLRHDMMRAKLAGYLERPGTVFNRYPASNTQLPARYARTLATFFSGGPRALDGALQQIDQLIKERPNNPHFWEMRGDFLVRSGRQSEAIPALRRALQLAPNANLIRVQLASALLATNEAGVVQEAADLLRRSLVEDENPRANRALADAYYRLGRQPEADAFIAEAHYLEGNLPQAQIFARRAMARLTKETPTWRRMDDILKAKPIE